MALEYDLTELNNDYATYGEGRWFALSADAAQQLPQMMFQFNQVRIAAGLYPVQVLVRSKSSAGMFSKIGTAGITGGSLGTPGGTAGPPPQSYFPDSYILKPQREPGIDAPAGGFVVTVPD